MDSEQKAHNSAASDTGNLLQANVEVRALREQLFALDERLASDLPGKIRASAAWQGRVF